MCWKYSFWAQERRASNVVFIWDDGIFMRILQDGAPMMPMLLHKAQSQCHSPWKLESRRISLISYLPFYQLCHLFSHFLKPVNYLGGSCSLHVPPGIGIPCSPCLFSNLAQAAGWVPHGASISCPSCGWVFYGCILSRTNMAGWF